MSQSLPMPPLPRLAPGLLPQLHPTWDALCNQIELQIRRMLAPGTLAGETLSATATGTTQVDAFQITTGLTIFTSVPVGAGANIATSGSGIVGNLDPANVLTLYSPTAGGTINGAASISVPANSLVTWAANSPTAGVAS